MWVMDTERLKILQIKAGDEYARNKLMGQMGLLRVGGWGLQ